MFECEMWIMKSKDTRMLGPQQMQFLCQPPDYVKGPYAQHSVRKAITVEGNEKQVGNGQATSNGSCTTDNTDFWEKGKLRGLKERV
jgi:hypothetical protein